MIVCKDVRNFGYVSEFMSVYVGVRLCSDYILKLILN